MSDPNPNYVTHVLEIAKARYGDNVAVTSIARQLREARSHAAHLRTDPGKRLGRIRDATAGTAPGTPLISVETQMLDEVLVELDAHRRVGVMALLLAEVLADLGERIEL